MRWVAATRVPPILRVSMSIKPKDVFEILHGIYQSIRADLEGIPLLDPGKPPSDHVWRPNSGPRGNEFVADFALACNRALEQEDDSRQILCNVYYLAMTPYPEARAFMGIREDVWAVWVEEIQDLCGRELMARGLFPPRTYFGERSRPRRNIRLRGPMSAARAMWSIRNEISGSTMRTASC